MWALHLKKSVVNMSSSPFLEDLPLLTPQQREQVRAAFQVALLESPLPTVLTNLEGRIVGTNALVEELFGVDEPELQGRLITEFVAEEDRRLTVGVIDRLATGKTRRESYETRFVRPDGRLLWVRRHVLRVDGPDGDAQPYLVALLEDVTRSRIAEREAAGLLEVGKRIAAGASLADIAARLGELAEQRWSQVGCMLNIADEKAEFVHPVPHARLPAGLADAMTSIPISTVGIPCGMAAAYGHPVAIRDLMNDPRTVSMHSVLKRFDIVSGWSLAVHDVEGDLLGTLGLFHPYMRDPDDADWQALRGYADVAAIAIMVDRQSAQNSANHLRSRALCPRFAQPVAGGDAVCRADEDDRPVTRSPVGAERLSNREQAIVTQLLAGDRVPAIARTIYLSPSTVRNHLSTIFRKLGVNSQQELVDLYRRSAPDP